MLNVSGGRQRRGVPIGGSVAVIVMCALWLGTIFSASAGAASAGRWLGAWGASMAGRGILPAEFSATYREFAHLSIGGSAVRVRLSNFGGSAPLRIDAATVAIRAHGASVVPGTVRTLTMNGSPTLTIAPGQVAYSDPVDLAVQAQQDLAISLYVSGRPTVTWHPDALETEYATLGGAGDHTGDVGASAFAMHSISVYWADAVDVLTDAASGTIVALGDSITDGGNTLPDTNVRWTDILAQREDALPSSDRLGVVDAGIAGNTICTPQVPFKVPIFGPTGLDRLDRDVLSQSGASDVIVFLGTNDIAAGTDAPTLISCLQQAIARIHAAGLPAIGATVIPRDFGINWTGAIDDPRRAAVNQWIRTSNAFDGYVDFDAAVRWSLFPNVMDPMYVTDFTHPNAAGHAAMANAIDLSLLRPTS